MIRGHVVCVLNKIGWRTVVVREGASGPALRDYVKHWWDVEDALEIRIYPIDGLHGFRPNSPDNEDVKFWTEGQ